MAYSQKCHYYEKKTIKYIHNNPNFFLILFSSNSYVISATLSHSNSYINLQFKNSVKFINVHKSLESFLYIKSFYFSPLNLRKLSNASKYFSS